MLTRLVNYYQRVGFKRYIATIALYGAVVLLINVAMAIACTYFINNPISISLSPISTVSEEVAPIPVQPTQEYCVHVMLTKHAAQYATIDACKLSDGTVQHSVTSDSKSLQVSVSNEDGTFIVIAHESGLSKLSVRYSGMHAHITESKFTASGYHELTLVVEKEY